MTTEECYALIGGDYADALRRLRSDKWINDFLAMFLEDNSYNLLLKAIEAGDFDEAFRMAHTLKGICANLSLTSLFEPAQALTEALREEKRDIEAAGSFLPKVKEEYQRAAEGINCLLDI